MGVLMFICFIFVLNQLPHNCYGATKSCDPIQGLTGCACRMSDTQKIIALGDLVKNDTQRRIPRFKTQDGISWDFGYHPCNNFNMFDNVTNPRPGHKKCVNVTAARYTSISAHICDSLGNMESGVFKYVVNPTFLSNYSGVSVTYRDASSVGAVIYLVCNKGLSLSDSRFNYLNVTEGVQETYYFSLESRCSCPGGCYVKIPKPSAASRLNSWTAYAFASLVLVLYAVGN